MRRVQEPRMEGLVDGAPFPIPDGRRAEPVGGKGAQLTTAAAVR